MAHAATGWQKEIRNATFVLPALLRRLVKPKVQYQYYGALQVKYAAEQQAIKSGPISTHTLAHGS